MVFLFLFILFCCLDFFSKEAGNAHDVFHHCGRIGEYVLVDPLKNIVGLGMNDVGIVDVTVSVNGGGQLQIEMLENIVVCLGGRVVGVGTALELVDLFVDTKFEGGRHQKRVDMITAIEE